MYECMMGFHGYAPENLQSGQVVVALVHTIT